MAFRPNFTGVGYDEDGSILLSGVSDDDPPNDLLAVRVVLAQGELVRPGGVETVEPTWHANVDQEGFEPGTATAFGVESRRENATTVTWAQTVQIPEAPR